MGGVLDAVGLGGKDKPDRSAEIAAKREQKRLDELEKKRRRALFGTKGGQVGSSVDDDDVGRRGSVLGN